MKILVTGASGFIGGHIVDTLASTVQGEIWATGRSTTDRFNVHSNVHYFTHDLGKELPQQECDVCIHCAGLADDHASMEQFTTNNVVATKNLLAAIKQCRLFVFISSASVYDFSDGNVRKEEDSEIKSPASRYGRSKLQAEKLVANSGIQSVYILRPRAVYGHGDRVLLPRILGLIKNGKMIVPDALSKRTSLTNIQNLCEAVEKSITVAKPGVHIFNIADSKEYSLKDVLREILKRKTGRSVFVEIPTSILRVLGFLGAAPGTTRLSSQSLDYITQNSVMSIGKAEKELNYTGEREFYSTLDQLNI